MSPALEAVLARAYNQHQVQGNAPGAVGALKAALDQDANLAEEAVAEQARLSAVVRARGMGGQHGDHVSAVLAEVLAAALAKGS